MKLSGFSTALFSTWYFLEELGLLFDAGDGVVSCLLQKSGKVRHIFITHADRDHVCGLLQLVQLNAAGAALQIHYPKDAGSFSAFADFSCRFDHHVTPPTWVPLAEGDEVEIKPGVFVRAIANQHIQVPGKTKSLSYAVERRTWKLKPAFHGLEGPEIAALRTEHGDAHVCGLRTRTLLGYAGDTPVEGPDFWRAGGAGCGAGERCEVLIHEATFFTAAEISSGGRHNLHSSLDALWERARDWAPGCLVLSHFSSRYRSPEVRAAVRAMHKRAPLPFPVKVLLPGHCERDILALSDVGGVRD